MKHWIIAASLFAATFLPSGDAGAELPDPCERQDRDLVDQILSQIRPIYDTTRNYDPIPTATPSFGPDGSYRTRRNMIVDSRCFAETTDPSVRQKLAAQFDDTVEQMLRTVDRCGRHRALAVVENAFIQRIARHPRFTCNPGECGANAGACAMADEGNRINLTVRAHWFNPATWFHEILHLSGGDNQSVDAHNAHSESSDAVDEVVFWERHCFSPSIILSMMRNGRPTACSSALSHHPGAPSARYNPRELRVACDLYNNYLVQERNFGRQVRDTLLPHVFRCAPHLDNHACPDPAPLNAKLATNPALARFTLPTASNYRDWLRANCPKYRDEIPEQFMPCLSSVLSGLEQVLAAEKAAGRSPLTLDEERAVLLSISTLSAKGDFVKDHLAKAQDFPDQAQARDSSSLQGAIATCARRPLLQGTSLCRQFDATVRAPMASLLRYWW